jgi:hypothetical protein
MAEEERDELEDDEPQLDPEDPGEVATRFATKGLGWSGRDPKE